MLSLAHHRNTEVSIEVTLEAMTRQDVMDTKKQHSSQKILVATDIASINTSAPLDVTNNIPTKTVSFGVVQIHEFAVGLGDNPAAISGGPPIQLDYEEPVAESVIPVSAYESAVAGERRRIAELRVPPEIRWKLVGNDVDLSEVQKIQRQRRHTFATLEYEPWEWVFERVVAKLRKIVVKDEAGRSAQQWIRDYKREKRSKRKTS